MERSRRRGFTLIEVLLVISIIVLLMTLLVPAVGAAVRAVKVTNAQRVVQTLQQAVVEYHRQFNAYPLDRVPGGVPFQDTTQDGYPPYTYPDGTKSTTLFQEVPDTGDTGTWNNKGYGGKFLVYFLMGPRGQGWHRPTTTLNSDVNYLNRYLTAEWDPPPGLSNFLVNKPIAQGCSQTKTFAVFADGFGLEGQNGGTIGYIRANAFSTSATDRWTISNGPFNGAIYNDCRSHPSYPGDDQGNTHLAKMLAQCPDSVGFMVISPGPDRKFGYRVPVMIFNGVYRKGSWANLATGLIDDIANFPLK